MTNPIGSVDATHAVDLISEVRTLAEAARAQAAATLAAAVIGTRGLVEDADILAIYDMSYKWVFNGQR